MRSYGLRQHKILRLSFLFITTIIAFIFLANVSYGNIFVELVHVDTTQYPTIKAYVRVIDGNGNVITDLTVSNFSIFEDGNAQTPKSATLFPPPIDPVAVALPLDHSGSMVDTNAIEDMKTATLLFIDQLRTDYDDACEIIRFDWKISVEQAFTTDKELLRDAVQSPWTTDWNGTKLYDTVYKAIEDTTAYTALNGSLGSVVLVSDGKDYTEEPEGPGSLNSVNDVISLAVSNGIRIFTVGLGSVDAEVLQQMADETGGSYFYAATPSDLEYIFLAIETQHVGGYILSYETSAAGCQDHILKISVTTDTGLVADDSKSFLICPADNPDNGGGFYISGGGSGGWCFIATAAYGSRMAKEVGVFQKVRDEYLLTHELGRAFVSGYYKYSPPLADWIAKHPAMRRMVRIGLYPVLEVSKWFVGKNPSE